MPEMPLINTSWLKPFADFFCGKEENLGACCEEAQIKLEIVVSGDGWITKTQLYTFLETLAKKEEMPEVGFVVGETITPDCLGELGSAMGKAETLGEVVRTFCELINRHVEGNHCWLEEGERGNVWLFNDKEISPGAGQIIADQAGLMSMINLVRLVAGPEWYPDQAHLKTRSTVSYRGINDNWRGQISYGKPATGFSFPSRWLLQPAGLMVKGDGQKSPGLLAQDHNLSDKLRLLLKDLLGVGGFRPSFEFMADLCDTSVRTLHRQLESTGKTYQNLLDEVRLDLARQRLTQTDLPIKEISIGLGYSGTNNFARAFRRMMGESPTAYRSRHESGHQDR